ncbi:unnamed protein product [marine sediment metagenome]|uniref:Uncharacterized protein n=1 Tax=marine sediment metagenome TaxID=412755 RepID=X0YDY8_9ZZZZ
MENVRYLLPLTKTEAPVFALNETGDPLSPLHEASTLYNPVLSPNVRVACASPSESVVLVSEERLWPVASAGFVATLQLTVTPLTAFPLASVTLTTKGLVKAVFAFPVWQLPETRAMFWASLELAVALKVMGEPETEVAEA